jgi:hypothetical protein
MYANVGFQPRMVQAVSLGAEPSGKLTALRQDVAHVTAVSDDFVEASSAGGKGPRKNKFTVQSAIPTDRA